MQAVTGREGGAGMWGVDVGVQSVSTFGRLAVTTAAGE